MKNNKGNYRLIICIFFSLFILFCISISISQAQSSLKTSIVRIKACTHDLDRIYLHGSTLIWRTPLARENMAFRPGEGEDCYWFIEKELKISIDNEGYQLLPMDETHWTKHIFTPEQHETDPYLGKTMAYWTGEFDLAEFFYSLNIVPNPLNKISDVQIESGKGEILIEGASQLWIRNTNSSADFYDFTFLYEYSPINLFADLESSPLAD